MATLNLNDGKLDIILRDKNIDNIYDVSNDILVYSKIINQKRNIYSFNENAEKLLVEDAHNPNFINNKQFLFLKDPYAGKICLYDLNDKKITYVGNNYNRIWRTNLTMLNDKYFIVKKHIIPYDPLTQYTVSGTNGVMLILPIKGPVAINEK